MISIGSRFQATMIGGAIGDALGYPIEFMSQMDIKSAYGSEGLRHYIVEPESGKALISDDTQMSLFTADGLLWSYYLGSYRGLESYAEKGIYPSYLRWYYTQTKELPEGINDSILKRQSYEKHGSFMEEDRLYARRAPGNTCLSALASGKMGSMDVPLNDSKGCGGVMRVAPIGLFLHDEPLQAFYVASEAAAITHGHPTGFLSAGALALMIALLVNGKTMQETYEETISHLKQYPEAQETVDALIRAGRLSNTVLQEEGINALGEGWVAEEALAMAWYAAKRAETFDEGIDMAVNHGGDSDSIGAICGNLLGARLGMEAIGEKWLNELECKDLILKTSDRLYRI